MQVSYKKLIVDQGGMKMVVPAMGAHQKDEEVLLQLLLAVRQLLPASHPKPFVMSGGDAAAAEWLHLD